MRFSLLAVPFAAVTLALAACQGGSVTDPTADQTARAGDIATGGSTGTTPSGYYTTAARVRCEVRSNRSKISVDGRNLSPADGKYSARASSGGKTAVSPIKSAVAGEAEFDFDSDSGDVAAGAVAIPANFITGDVTGEVLDAAGKVVASATVKCTAK